MESVPEETTVEETPTEAEVEEPTGEETTSETSVDVPTEAEEEAEQETPTTADDVAKVEVSAGDSDSNEKDDPLEEAMESTVDYSREEQATDDQPQDVSTPTTGDELGESAEGTQSVDEEHETAESTTSEEESGEPIAVPETDSEGAESADSSGQDAAEAAKASSESAGQSYGGEQESTGESDGKDSAEVEPEQNVDSGTESQGSSVESQQTSPADNLAEAFSAFCDDPTMDTNDLLSYDSGGGSVEDTLRSGALTADAAAEAVSSVIEDKVEKHEVDDSMASKIAAGLGSLDSIHDMQTAGGAFNIAADILDATGNTELAKMFDLIGDLMTAPDKALINLAVDNFKDLMAGEDTSNAVLNEATSPGGFVDQGVDAAAQGMDATTMDQATQGMETNMNDFSNQTPDPFENSSHDPFEGQGTSADPNPQEAFNPQDSLGQATASENASLTAERVTGGLGTDVGAETGEAMLENAAAAAAEEAAATDLAWEAAVLLL